MTIFGNLIILKNTSKKEGARMQLMQEKKLYMFGRDEQCEIRIQMPKVSRNHARLVNEGLGKIFLEDISKTNPTLLNGRPFKRQRLQNNDEIDICGRIFRFERTAPKMARKPLSTKVLDADVSLENQTITDFSQILKSPTENAGDLENTPSRRERIQMRPGTPYHTTKIADSVDSKATDVSSSSRDLPKRVSQQTMHSSKRIIGRRSSSHSMSSRERSLKQSQPTRRGFTFSKQRRNTMPSNKLGKLDFKKQPLRSVLKKTSSYASIENISSPKKSLQPTVMFQEGDDQIEGFEMFKMIQTYIPNVDRDMYFSSRSKQWDLHGMREDVSNYRQRAVEKQDKIDDDREIELKQDLNSEASHIGGAPDATEEEEDDEETESDRDNNGEIESTNHKADVGDEMKSSDSNEYKLLNNDQLPSKFAVPVIPSSQSDADNKILRARRKSDSTKPQPKQQTQRGRIKGALMIGVGTGVRLHNIAWSLIGAARALVKDATAPSKVRSSAGNLAEGLETLKTKDADTPKISKRLSTEERSANKIKNDNTVSPSISSSKNTRTSASKSKMSKLKTPRTPERKQLAASSSKSTQSLSKSSVTTPRTPKQKQRDDNTILDGLAELFATPKEKLKEKSRNSLEKIHQSCGELELKVNPEDLPKDVQIPKTVSDCVEILSKTPKNKLKIKQRLSVENAIIETLSDAVNTASLPIDEVVNPSDPAQVESVMLRRISNVTNSSLGQLPQTIAAQVETGIEKMVEEADDDYSEALSRLFKTPKGKLARRLSNRIYEGISEMIRPQSAGKRMSGVSEHNREAVSDSLSLVMEASVDNVSEVLQSLPTKELTLDDEVSKEKIPSSKKRRRFSVFDGVCQLMVRPASLDSLTNVCPSSPAVPERKRQRDISQSPRSSQSPKRIRRTSVRSGSPFIPSAVGSFSVGTISDQQTSAVSNRRTSLRKSLQSPSSVTCSRMSRCSMGSSLPTPLKKEILSHKRQAQHEIKKPYPTPVREGIRSRIPPPRHEIVKALSTPLKKSIKQAKAPVVHEIKKVLSTPLKKAIKQAKAPVVHENKKVLSTPLKKAIKQAKAPVVREIKKVLHTPLKKSIKESKPPVRHEIKKVLSTPLRASIKNVKPTKFQKMEKPLSSPLRKDIQAVKRPIQPKMKKALGTPLRKGIESGIRRLLSRTLKVLQSPLRKEIKTGGRRLPPRARNVIKSPLRKEIKTGSRRLPPRARKVLHSPLRKDIETGTRRLPPRARKVLRSPLRKGIETGTRRLPPKIMKVSGTPLRKEFETVTHRLPPRPRKVLNSPLQKEIKTGTRRLPPRVRKVISSPFRKEVKTGTRGLPPKIQKSVDTPLRKDIKTGMRRLPPKIRKALDTPLRKDVETGTRCLPTKMKKVLPSPLLKDIKMGVRSLRSKLRHQKVLSSPLKKVIQTGIKLRHRETPKKIEASVEDEGSAKDVSPPEILSTPVRSTTKVPRRRITRSVTRSMAKKHPKKTDSIIEGSDLVSTQSSSLSQDSVKTESSKNVSDSLNAKPLKPTRRQLLDNWKLEKIKNQSKQKNVKKIIKTISTKQRGRPKSSTTVASNSSISSRRKRTRGDEQESAPKKRARTIADSSVSSSSTLIASQESKLPREKDAESVSSSVTVSKKINLMNAKTRKRTRLQQSDDVSIDEPKLKRTKASPKGKAVEKQRLVTKQKGRGNTEHLAYDEPLSKISLNRTRGASRSTSRNLSESVPKVSRSKTSVNLPKASVGARPTRKSTRVVKSKYL